MNPFIVALLIVIAGLIGSMTFHDKDPGQRAALILACMLVTPLTLVIYALYVLGVIIALLCIWDDRLRGIDPAAYAKRNGGAASPAAPTTPHIIVPSAAPQSVTRRD